jgi:hypothetical protein
LRKPRKFFNEEIERNRFEKKMLGNIKNLKIKKHKLFVKILSIFNLKNRKNKFINYFLSKKKIKLFKESIIIFSSFLKKIKLVLINLKYLKNKNKLKILNYLFTIYKNNKFFF